ncbi:MAG: hypothetical protein JSV63_02805, partial [Candidatus Aenigmatarchaeota archaeon]
MVADTRVIRLSDGYVLNDQTDKICLPLRGDCAFSRAGKDRIFHHLFTDPEITGKVRSGYLDTVSYINRCLTDPEQGVSSH